MDLNKQEENKESLLQHLNIESTFSFDPMTIKLMLIEDAEFRDA